jgi:serine/threonine protein kinase
MSAARCPRHPEAAAHAGHCSACLLENAMGAEVESDLEPAARFTIEVPLGRSDTSSVFLVRGEWPWRRVLRLKQWTRPAPPTFLGQFSDLRSRLEQFAHPAIVTPLTSWLEPGGTPSALTEFRQGLPLLEALERGRLANAAALSLLRELRAVVGAAHAAGLVHGSIVSGNVFVAPSCGSSFLLDFGFAPLLAASSEDVWRAADLAGLGFLESLASGIRGAGDAAG